MFVTLEHINVRTERTRDEEKKIIAKYFKVYNIDHWYTLVSTNLIQIFFLFISFSCSSNEVNKRFSSYIMPLVNGNNLVRTCIACAICSFQSINWSIIECDEYNLVFYFFLFRNGLISIKLWCNHVHNLYLISSFVSYFFFFSFGRNNNIKSKKLKNFKNVT